MMDLDVALLQAGYGIRENKILHCFKNCVCSIFAITGRKYILGHAEWLIKYQQGLEF